MAYKEYVAGQKLSGHAFVMYLFIYVWARVDACVYVYVCTYAYVRAGACTSTRMHFDTCMDASSGHGPECLDS
jgi:hypothetical protein